MLDVRAGDRIVVGYEGVRVRPPRTTVETPAAGEGFGFMQSDVSSEKPPSRRVPFSPFATN